VPEIVVRQLARVDQLGELVVVAQIAERAQAALERGGHVLALIQLVHLEGIGLVHHRHDQPEAYKQVHQQARIGEQRREPHPVRRVSHARLLPAP